MKIVSLLIGIIFTSVSFNSLAGGGINGTISQINIKETGYVLITLTAAHNNPDSCETTDKVVFAHSHIAKQEMISVSLAAMTSGKSSNFWLSGCYEAYGTTFPIAITAAIKN